MDKKLLDALNNLSNALEQISDALENKKGEKSPTATALQSGNLGKQLELIDKGIKQLQSDNKKILKNQETIIELAKKKSDGSYDPFNIASDPKQKSRLKDGVGSIVLIAVGVLAIGMAFKLIGSVNFASVIALSIALPLVAMAFEKIASLKGMKARDMVNVVIVTVSIALAITLSSHILSMVKPVGLFQLFTSVMIATMFSVVSYGIGSLIMGIKKMGTNPSELGKIAIILPIVLVGISVAIALASVPLSMVKPIGLFQFFTSVMIAIVFIPISYAMPLIARAMKDIDIKKIVLLPIMMVAMAASIWLSSMILSKVENIPVGKLFNIVFQSVTMSIIGVSLGVTLGILSKIGLQPLIQGGLALVVIATTVMITSHILSLGNYSKSPDVSWALTAGMSLVGFGLSAVVLGTIAMNGVGALAIVAGSAMILLVAATIVATAKILELGNYGNYPPVSWSASIGLSLLAFGVGAMGIGTLIVGTLGLGAIALTAGLGAILMISNSIVESSFILSKGNYKGGPTLQWAGGIALALGAFAPIYGMMMANSIFSLFGGGGAGPEDFATAIRVIASGISEAAFIFNNSKVAFSGGPSKSWAEGVGQAIGAFAPVYKVLSESKGLFSGGPSVDEMRQSILTISQGIVDSANFFGQNTSSFDINKIPKKEWGENVSGAIKAFIPALDFITKNSGIFSNGSEMLLDGITDVSKGIVASSIILYKGKFDKKIPDGWMKNVSDNVKQYVDMAKYLFESGSDDIDITDITDGMVELAKGYSLLAEGVSKLNTQLNQIDMEKLTALKNLTGSVIMLSLMDSDQFESMMDALEDKAKIFIDVMNDVDKSSSERVQRGVKVVSSSQIKTGSNNKVSTRSMDDIYNVMSSMDSRLATISKSNDNLSKYVDEIRGGDDIDLKKKK